MVTILFMLYCPEVQHAITETSGRRMHFKVSTKSPFGPVECDEWLAMKCKVGEFKVTNMVVTPAELLNKKLNRL